VLHAALSLCEQCLDVRLGEGEAGLAAAKNIKRLHFLVVERGARAGLDYSCRVEETAHLVHMLTQFCACAFGGLYHDLALSVAAQVLSQVPFKAMRAVAAQIVERYDKLGAEEDRVAIDLDVEGSDLRQTSTTSAAYAHTRVLRDIFFEAASGTSEAGRANALYLVGCYAVNALGRFSGAVATPSQRASLSAIESWIFGQLRGKGQAIIAKALERTGKNALWEFHDLLKMLDLYLYCLPSVREFASQGEAAGAKGKRKGPQGAMAHQQQQQQQQRLFQDWLHFLNEVGRRLKRLEKESARYTVVLASELRTTYDLLSRKEKDREEKRKGERVRPQ